MSEKEKTMTDKEEKVEMRSLVTGVVLVMVSNLIYIGNNYAVKWAGLLASELSMVRGLTQVVVFVLLMYNDKRRRKDDILETKQKQISKTFIVSLLLYGFFMASMSFACLAAIPLMPIGDLIVISFTSPAFSVFLARLMMKTPLTVLGVILSVTIVFGDVLVVQPPFLFGEEDTSHTDNNATEMAIRSEEVSGPRGTPYYIGVALCAYAAFAGAISNVLSTQLSSTGTSTNLLMLVAGSFSFLLSLVSLSFMENRIVNGEGLSLNAALLLPAAATVTMSAFWLITLALDITRNPTLVAMLRSTEILFSLFTESLYYQQVPQPLSFIGSIIVLVCVASMTVRDPIESRLAKITQKLLGRDKTKRKHSLQVEVTKF